MFAYNFVKRSEHTALTPADTCLNKLGSMEERVGLVVCDSSLNLMKTKIYKLQNPVDDTTWLAWFLSLLPSGLERALSYVQTVRPSPRAKRSFSITPYLIIYPGTSEAEDRPEKLRRQGLYCCR
ncbi:hypothetical protein LZ32DRAFT_23656 [Colletotrichum eremochloae]|nr:hypothetical protein LZ32DRAFT_23656 [Colletotrichum eremochloae]